MRHATSTAIIPVISRMTKTRVSRGDIDDINPDDVVYGEYTNDRGEKYGEYIDLIYLDGDILRTFSGSVSYDNPVLKELHIILRDDKKFYVVRIKEVKAGFAFKRNDIRDIRVTSVISSAPPSCVWVMKFETGSSRSIETNYQSYFTYGNTNRPKSTTNAIILDKVFPGSNRK